MRFYKSKGGYYYKEYNNGKKVRISNEYFHKQLKKSKQYNKSLKGGINRNNNSTIDLSKLTKFLVTLKKKINKINELSKRLGNLKELPNKLPNNLPNNLNTVHNRMILAMIANHHKYKRNSSGPTLNLSYNYC